MGKLSTLNPLPLHLGRNPSQTERVWRAMRGALGTNTRGAQAAGPEAGVEDTWRRAKARVIARERQRLDLAVEQGFPQNATVHLGLLEDELNIPREATDVQRQAAVAAAYTAQLGAVIPSIREYLQATFDSGLDVVTWDSDQAIRSRQGKAFASTGDAYLAGTRESGLLSNFASEFVLAVMWTGLVAGIPDPLVLQSVRDYLNGVLPSWCDFVIFNGVGFYLDGFNDSRLDLTAFS